MKRILVADHSEIANRMFCAGLSKYGFSVSAVSTTEELIHKCTTEEIDMLLLDLDLDHLGSTDVSVRMRGREVSTRFYLDNDTAYALLEKNYPVLEARLEKKGYHCKIDVVNEEKHVNFVDDFLKMDQPAATQLHRYSFDMRA